MLILILILQHPPPATVDSPTVSNQEDNPELDHDNTNWRVLLVSWGCLNSLSLSLSAETLQFVVIFRDFPLCVREKENEGEVKKEEVNPCENISTCRCALCEPHWAVKNLSLPPFHQSKDKPSKFSSCIRQENVFTCSDHHYHINQFHLFLHRDKT